MASIQHNLTAIIYDKKGKILSLGKNSYVKTHPLQARYGRKVGLEKKVFLHAEIDAIIKCRDLSKAHKIVVFRFTKNGQPANATPCKVCQEALRDLLPDVIIEHT